MIRLFLLSLIMVTLSGCGMLAGSKSKSQSLATAERLTAQSEATLRRATAGTPPQPISLEVKGRENKVDISIPQPSPTTAPVEEVEMTQNSGQVAGTTVSWLYKSRWAIPIGLSLLLLAAGLMAVWFVWGRLKQSSAAIRAASELADKQVAVAFQAADKAISELQSRTGERMAQSTDSATNVVLAAEMAALEKRRRQLRDEMER